MLLVYKILHLILGKNGSPASSLKNWSWKLIVNFIWPINVKLFKVEPATTDSMLDVCCMIYLTTLSKAVTYISRLITFLNTPFDMVIDDKHKMI